MKLGSSRVAYVLPSAGMCLSWGCVVSVQQGTDKFKECKRNVRRQMLESDVVAVPPKISVPILHAPSCNPLIPLQPGDSQAAPASISRAFITSALGCSEWETKGIWFKKKKKERKCEASLVHFKGSFSILLHDSPHRSLRCTDLKG